MRFIKVFLFLLMLKGLYIDVCIPLVLLLRQLMSYSFEFCLWVGTALIDLVQTLTDMISLLS